MKSLTTHAAGVSLLLALPLTLVKPAAARGEINSAMKAQALLEEVKRTDYERQLAAKQTELDRFSEDLKKGEMEAVNLQKSIDEVVTAVSEATSDFDQLTAQRQRLTEGLEVITLRIEAEKLKVEGLKLLRDAQTKAKDALTKQNEEIALRASLGNAQMKQLAQQHLPPIGESSINPPEKAVASKSTSSKNAPPAVKPGTDVADLKKQLAKSTLATAASDTLAQEAMQTATTKLKQADAAADKARKRAVELGLEGPAPRLPAEMDNIDAPAIEKPPAPKPAGAAPAAK